MTESLTEEQAEELVRGFAESRMTIPNFLNNVVKAIDTSKVGNLDEEELGTPKLPVRSFQELEIFSKDVANQKAFADYFHKLSESTLATSLSKKGFLLRIAVTTKKELADVSPERKQNKGWFKPKSQPQGEQNA